MAGCEITSKSGSLGLRHREAPSGFGRPPVRSGDLRCRKSGHKKSRPELAALGLATNVDPSPPVHTSGTKIGRWQGSRSRAWEMVNRNSGMRQVEATISSGDRFRTVSRPRSGLEGPAPRPGATAPWFTPRNEALPPFEAQVPRWRRRSGRHQRRVQSGALADDAAAIARRDPAVAFGEHRRQWARARRRQPQSQQMPLALNLWPVLVAGSGVQNRVIMQELNVARHERHVEPQVGIAGEVARACRAPRYPRRSAAAPRETAATSRCAAGNTTPRDGRHIH